MGKTTAKTIEVPSGYLAPDRYREAADAICKAIGCQVDEYGDLIYRIDDIFVDVLSERVYRHSREAKIAGVKLGFQSGVTYRKIFRSVNVKDGHLNLSLIEAKFLELKQLKELDDSDYREKKEKERESLNRYHQTLAECAERGLDMRCWSVKEDGLKLLVEHQRFTVDQAVQVQALFDSFKVEA